MHETYTERRIRQEEKRHSLKDMATGGGFEEDRVTTEKEDTVLRKQAWQC